MDSDGDSVVNNFDYISIKMNWMRWHGAQPAKAGSGFNTQTFDMSQNYPNPFNPTTSIRYSVPERSNVQLRLLDMLGRTVETSVNGTVEAGVHTLTFDAANLPTGQHVATVNMSGFESGLTFSKTIRMTLAM